jgi:hypothetical protein
MSRERNGMVRWCHATAWLNGDECMYYSVSLVLVMKEGVQERTQDDIWSMI